MSQMMVGVTLTALVALGIVAARPAAAQAQVKGPVIVVDELGNGIGTRGPGILAPDPGPGGLPAVLTYTLPFEVVPGDVRLNGPDEFSDVVRFNSNGNDHGTLLFYSDTRPGDLADTLADTTSPPTSSYDNLKLVNEIGTEDQNGAVYTPGPNDPGFNPASPTYILISDSGVAPEPGSLALLATGGLPLLGLLRRRLA